MGWQGDLEEAVLHKLAGPHAAFLSLRRWNAFRAYLGEVPTISPPAANERNNARLAGCPAGVRPDKRLCHMGDERIELRLRGLGIFHP
jgi:hypothetical protein